jgi:hypothetical protein
MMIFDKIDQPVPMKMLIEYCPFCTASYLTRTEVRPVVSCPICKGESALAIGADREVAEIFETLGNSHATPELLTRIDGFANKLGIGYWRMEYRALLRKKREEMESSGEYPT